MKIEEKILLGVFSLTFIILLILGVMIVIEGLDLKIQKFYFEVDENGNPWSPSWYTLNFKVMYHATNFMSFNLGVENITNQRYRPYSSGIAAAGINFIGSLRFTF